MTKSLDDILSIMIAIPLISMLWAVAFYIIGSIIYHFYDAVREFLKYREREIK